MREFFNQDDAELDSKRMNKIYQTSGPFFSPFGSKCRQEARGSKPQIFCNTSYVHCSYVVLVADDFCDPKDQGAGPIGVLAVEHSHPDLQRLCRDLSSRLAVGPYINDIYTIFGFLTPSPLVCILARSLVLKSLNLLHYVCI